MSTLEFTFVLICATLGAIAGYGIWTILPSRRPAPEVAAAPAATPRRLDRPEPPIVKTAHAGEANIPALNTLPIQETLHKILEALSTAEAARIASENRLLAEMRAVMTADDPDIRDRLDRIAEALDITGEVQADLDAEAAAQDKMDQWRAEFAAEDEDSDGDVPDQSFVMEPADAPDSDNGTELAQGNDGKEDGVAGEWTQEADTDDAGQPDPSSEDSPDPRADGDDIDRGDKADPAPVPPSATVDAAAEQQQISVP